jgi:hypothetical protein
MERGERRIAIPLRKWATFFAGVTRAGEGKPSPLRGKIQMPPSMSTEPFQISDGFVDIAQIYEADGAPRMPDRVMPTQIGHICVGRHSSGRGEPSPLGENSNAAGCRRLVGSNALRHESINFRSPSFLWGFAFLLLCLRLDRALPGPLAIPWLARRRGHWDWRRYTFDRLLLCLAE